MCVLICVCVKKRANKDEFKEAEETKDEKSGRQGVRNEQLWSVPQQCPPWPLFCFSRSHSGRLLAPEGLGPLPRTKRITNKQQTNQRGKTFIWLQLTGLTQFNFVFRTLVMRSVGFSVCVQDSD